MKGKRERRKTDIQATTEFLLKAVDPVSSHRCYGAVHTNSRTREKAENLYKSKSHGPAAWPPGSLHENANRCCRLPPAWGCPKWVTRLQPPSPQLVPSLSIPKLLRSEPDTFPSWKEMTQVLHPAPSAPAPHNLEFGDQPRTYPASPPNTHHSCLKEEAQGSFLNNVTERKLSPCSLIARPWTPAGATFPPRPPVWPSQRGCASGFPLPAPC